uniref:Uncharacterized protein n=1 Tax=Rhizophora mucronata TaxID=61149 RepID=A0A2P2NMG6_RHIMU
MENLISTPSPQKINLTIQLYNYTCKEARTGDLKKLCIK